MGVDFKVFNAGTELTTGKELEKSYSGAVKFTILSPKGTLKATQK